MMRPNQCRRPMKKFREDEAVSMSCANVPRPGLKDVWNAYMVDDTGPEDWSPNDIPFCPTTAEKAPENLVSFSAAKTMHKKMMRRSEYGYHVNAFIHCFIDDAKFDGFLNSIWKHPSKLLDIAKHYDGIIVPDFSTYVDFPDPIRRYNVYRMRTFGRYAARMGHAVIANARWGLPKTWVYDFDGIPKHSMLAVGTVGSGIRYVANRPLFEAGLYELVRRCNPHTLIVYGSAKLPIFDEVRDQGVRIVQFDSETCKGYARMVRHE